jgi:hypothetical protein
MMTQINMGTETSVIDNNNTTTSKNLDTSMVATYIEP